MRRTPANQLQVGKLSRWVVGESPRNPPPPNEKRTFVRAWAIIPTMRSLVSRRGGGQFTSLNNFCWGVTIIYSLRAHKRHVNVICLSGRRSISTPLCDLLQLSPTAINIGCGVRTPESNPSAHISARDLPFLIRSLSRPAGNSPASQRRTDRCLKRGQPASVECQAEIWRRPVNI